MFAIESERFRDEIVLSARTLLVVLFLIFGWSKLMNYDAAVSYMAMTNAPAPQIAAAIAIAIECLVSVAVLFGIFTRPLALLMVAYTLATALIGHHYWTMSGADQYSNERELRAGGVPVAIGAREFEIIEVLVESANELVTKNDLMDRIWPGAAVGENTLQVHISAIRKALGRDRAPLKTASGRSYRLLGDWTARRHDASTAPIGLPRIRLTGEAAGTNFPVTVTRLVGRSTAVRQSQDLISAWRILTLTGPGRSDGPRAGRLVLGAPDRAEPRASAADQGRRDEARLILRPLYDRFIERFEAADLRAACAIPDAPPS